MNNYNQYYDFVDRNNNLNNSNMLDFNKDPYDAFLKGNSFNNLYHEYKNYKPKEVKPRDEKEYLLLLVQIYGFVAHDLGLCLDVNPSDSQALQLRANYINLHNQAVNQYESKYGPLDLDSNMLDNSPWSWNNDWPWEVQK